MTYVELWIVAAAACIAAGTALWTVWLVRARIARKRLCSVAFRSIPAVVLPIGLRTSEPDPAPTFSEEKGVPDPAFVDLRRFHLEKAAVLDAIHSAYQTWIFSEQGSAVLAAAVRHIPDELVQAGSVLGAGMEKLGNLAQNMEQLFQAALPVELWTWLEASRIVDLAHAVEQKVNLLDSGQVLHFSPESASPGFDLGLHFPWMTAILSGTRELRLVHRGDTSLGRALSHVALDISAVSVGVLAGTTAAGGAVAVISFLLDITLTAGTVTLFTAILGTGGAFAGAKAAKKLRFMPVERLSEQYARLLKESTSPLKSAKQAGQTRLHGLYGAFDKRREALVAELGTEWMRKLESLSAEWNILEAVLHPRALCAVRTCLAQAEERLERAETQCRRRIWRLWWPAWANVEPCTEARLLRQTVAALSAAERRLAATGIGDTKTILTILEEAAEKDPLTSVAPLLGSFGAAVLRLDRRCKAVREEHRALARARFSSLERERDEAAKGVLQSVAAATEPILARLRSLEASLRREARALGGAFT